MTILALAVHALSATFDPSAAVQSGALQTPSANPPAQAGSQPPAPSAQTPPAQTAPGQTPPATTDGAYDLGVVETVMARPRGSVASDIPPDIVLDEEQLKAYGAGNIAELIEALAPLTQSSRGSGPPVMLVNGRRISGFQEIAGIPTEAIERTEILPEDVALAYGYRADQRVMNFVLKANYGATTVQTDVRRPTQGGRTSQGVDLNLFNIAGRDRRSFDFEYDRDTALFETERDITRSADGGPFSLDGTIGGATPGGEIDPALSALLGSTVRFARAPNTTAAPTLADFAAGANQTSPDDLLAYRTLMPAREKLTARGSITRDINHTTTGTISLSVEDTSTLSYLGLPTVSLNVPGAGPWSPFAGDVRLYRYVDDPGAMTRDVDTLATRAAGLLDGFIGDWRWTLSGNYDRTETDTRTGRGYDVSGLQAAVNAGSPGVNPFGPLPAVLLPRLADDTANSVSSVAATELVFTGNLFEAPAGQMRSTIKFGLDTRSLDSTSVRGGVLTERSQSRDRANVQGNFSLPIASRSGDVLAPLGDLSANMNFTYEELSDFGGLTTLGGGVNWTPIEPLSLSFSYATEDGAPTISQLNDPVVFTPNVQVYDYATGQTVNITRIDGGNAALSAENKQTLSFGVNWRPFATQDLSIRSGYTRTQIDDQIASFPTITADLEAAMPDRFTRDAAGQLTSIDARPVTFKRATRQDVRTVLNFSRAFGTPTAMPAGRPGGPGMGAGGPRPGGPGAGPRPGGPGGGGTVIISSTGGGGGGSTVTVNQGPRRGTPMQPGQGRFNVSLTHTWRLQDEVVIRDGLPTLDLLDGASISGRGGQPVHELQLQSGVFRNGMGMFLWGVWRDSTRVDGGPTGQDLFFSDQATLSLNAFIDFNARPAWTERYPWLKGARLNMGVQNVFDTRTEVRDAAGNTPLSYQRDRMDPNGRTFSINLRKLF